MRLLESYSDCPAGMVDTSLTTLTNHPMLAPIPIALPDTFPAGSPAGISGDIIIQSRQFVINSPLEMMPGASIRVKPGAMLRAKGLSVYYTTFTDERAGCDPNTPRAKGIYSEEAGFRCTSNIFEGLGEGIYASQLRPANGSLSAFSNTFRNCHTGLWVDLGQSFLISKNEFFTDASLPCPPHKVVGANITGNTLGFTFAGQAPCTSPCSEEEIQEVKPDFYRYGLQWKEALEELPFISDEEEREQIQDTIYRLRLSMNREASLVLQHYALDTVEVKSEIQPNGNIRLYPNPAQDKLFLELPSPAEARLYNMQGALVKRWRLGGGASPYTLDFGQQGLPSGIYLVEVHTAQGQVFRQKAILSI